LYTAYSPALRQVPAELVNYWMQRYSLWSRYDAGVRMDAEAWFSATPEVVAAHHARAPFWLKFQTPHGTPRNDLPP